jgi:gluconokinase
MVIIVFGLPGVGKDFLGKLIAEEFGFFWLDADQDLASEHRELLRQERPVPRAIRDEFYRRLIAKIDVLAKPYPNLVVSQVFHFEKDRVEIARRHPSALFLWVRCSAEVWERRLQREHFITPAYAKKLIEVFEQPRLPHCVFYNDDEDRAAVVAKLAAIINDSLTTS